MSTWLTRSSDQALIELVRTEQTDDELALELANRLEVSIEQCGILYGFRSEVIQLRKELDAALGSDKWMYEELQK